MLYLISVNNSGWKNETQLIYILERSLLTKIHFLEMGYDLLGFKLLHSDFVPSSQEWKIQDTHITQLNTAAPHDSLISDLYQ